MAKDQATRQVQMLHARRVYVHPMNTAVFWAVIAAGAWVGLLWRKPLGVVPKRRALGRR